MHALWGITQIWILDLEFSVAGHLSVIWLTDSFGIRILVYTVTCGFKSGTESGFTMQILYLLSKLWYDIATYLHVNLFSECSSYPFQVYLKCSGCNVLITFFCIISTLTYCCRMFFFWRLSTPLPAWGSEFSALFLVKAYSCHSCWWDGSWWVHFPFASWLWSAFFGYLGNFNHPNHA